jgi:hypothetical protein
MAKSRRRKRRPPGEYRAPRTAEPKQAAAPPASGRRRGPDERPPAPWGSFPLVEVAVLVGLVMLIVGFVRNDPVTVVVGILLGALAGLELSAREHFAGYRSHTTLLAGTALVLTVGVLYYAAGLPLAAALVAGAAAFAAAFLALRRAFRRASGGLSYRIGGLGG